MLDKTILYDVYVQCKKEFPGDPASSKFQFEYISKLTSILSKGGLNAIEVVTIVGEIARLFPGPIRREDSFLHKAITEDE